MPEKDGKKLNLDYISNSNGTDGINSVDRKKKQVEKVEVDHEFLKYEEEVEKQMDDIIICIEEINACIGVMRNKFNNFTKVYGDIKKKNKGIVLYNDGKDFLKELNLQKQLIEKELEFFISIRDLLFKQLYNELYSISKSLINLEVILYSDRINNQEHYKTQKYTELKNNAKPDRAGCDEINKLLDINLNSVKEISSQINNHSKYLNEISKKGNEGFDIKNFLFSLQSQSKKLGIELDTNKNQLKNILDEHLIKFICCNSKLKYSINLSNKCNEEDNYNFDELQKEIDDAIVRMSPKKDLKLSVEEVAIEIKPEIENSDLERKKKLNKALYGNNLKSTFDEVDNETVIT